MVTFSSDFQQGRSDRQSGESHLSAPAITPLSCAEFALSFLELCKRIKMYESCRSDLYMAKSFRRKKSLFRLENSPAYIEEHFKSDCFSYPIVYNCVHIQIRLKIILTSIEIRMRLSNRRRTVAPLDELNLLDLVTLMSFFLLIFDGCRLQ